MIRARVKGKQILFTSPISEQRFFELADGKDVNISIDDKPTGEMRRFFEGAVVPAIFYQNPFSGWENFSDAREALLIEFLPRWAFNLKGERVRSRRSSTELNKKSFTALLDIVTNWMLEQGMEIPDPEEYKRWRDSAPDKGEIFPQLKRLKDLYDTKLAS